MKNHSININNKPFSSLHQKITNGVNLAVKEALNKHRKLDEAISIYQDGKIITLKGEQIAKFLENNS
ncbi:hypothetical protein VKI21_12260 [Cyanobacterium aponinum UTEX 3222]|uniref:hypothetical protein n=1 Tax=Cyanobacterium aponinum TaxID=379064 RepID=UPI0030916765|nr:hypothetical protein VKI21_12260 [Cyanobacterium aponinum UTEX 3222]